MVVSSSSSPAALNTRLRQRKDVTTVVVRSKRLILIWGTTATFGLVSVFYLLDTGSTMQSPYTPRYSRVPNPTPRASASIKPPIHNPYDKFTQPEFEDWIDGITTALRKALGQEEEDAQLPVQEHGIRQSDTSKVATPAADEDEDDGVNDSFADLKARRAKVRGKMRAGSVSDDDEGSEYEESVSPTNARGSSPNNAIELSSDEDEEEDDDGEEASVRNMIRDLTPESETSEDDLSPEASNLVQPLNTTAEVHYEVSDDDDETGERGFPSL
jgi:hypothetical protein